MVTDMEIDESYKGREHSLVKHKLLEGYLEKLLFIKCMSGSNAITYVDCFAGPWGDESSDIKGTSIAISLRILHKVRDALAAKYHKYDVKFKAIYIEQAKRRFRRLKEYLDSSCPAEIKPVQLQGDYSELQDEILKHCENSFTFFFVDPKQWTPVAIPKLQKLLARPNSEFMITFMYDFLNRAITNEDLRSQVCSVLGTLADSDISHISGLESKEREQIIVRRYMNALKAQMTGSGQKKPRSYHATVQDKDKDRTKYHLVYLTSHPKGIIEFSKCSEDVEIFQRKVKFHTSRSKTGMDDMFGIDDETIKAADAIDGKVVKEYWLKRLITDAVVYSESDLADMLEETGWLESDLQRAFGELSEAKQVENVDAKRKREKRPIHFEKNERLRKLS